MKPGRERFSRFVRAMFGWTTGNGTGTWLVFSAISCYLRLTCLSSVDARAWRRADGSRRLGLTMPLPHPVERRMENIPNASAMSLNPAQRRCQRKWPEMARLVGLSLPENPGHCAFSPPLVFRGRIEVGVFRAVPIGSTWDTCREDPHPTRPRNTRGGD